MALNHTWKISGMRVAVQGARRMLPHTRRDAWLIKERTRHILLLYPGLGQDIVQVKKRGLSGDNQVSIVMSTLPSSDIEGIRMLVVSYSVALDTTLSIHKRHCIARAI